MKTNQIDLRTLLEQEISANYDIASHVVKLEEISVRFPHSIKIHPFPFVEFPYVGTQDECNCVVYALNLYNLVMPCRPLGGYRANTDYVRSLIDDGHLTEIFGAPNEGSLAIYFIANKVAHIAKVAKDSRFVSKWGAGLLYEHLPLEVCSSYGDVIRFFNPIGENKALKLLSQFECRSAR